MDGALELLIYMYALPVSGLKDRQHMHMKPVSEWNEVTGTL
jgi:hypothetical protein